MLTDFLVLSAETVPNNYVWDSGTPLDFTTTNTPAFIGTNYVSGYAPAVRVLFDNQSVSDFGFTNFNYDWDFGDYYNNTHNRISLSCVSIVQHTYIMPGIYTVSLRHKQTKTLIDPDQTGQSAICRGKFGRRWFWDELNCLGPQGVPNLFATTWNEVSCDAPLQKWWDNEFNCLQKYCKFWTWSDTISGGLNTVKWNETQTDAVFEKKWMFEANDTICAIQEGIFLSTTETEEQTIIKTHLIEVKELLPKAFITPISAVVGTSPLAVQLSPKNCIAGSFPIDRIVWDFGDGSPLKTIIRYTPPENDPEIIFTGNFGQDLNDVRNYDIVHTYTRTKDVYPVFYPSLTCYSANTNSSDACSITVGPLSFPQPTTETYLLKARNTLKGTIYTFSQDNSISLATTNTKDFTIVPPSVLPNNKLRSGQGINQIYFGYNGDGFPQPYTPSCDFITGTQLPERFLVTEDSTPFNTTDNLDDNGIPILTERDVFIFP